MVIVEGISDQIALEAVADSSGRDLGAEGVVIVPVGGAHAIDGFLARLGPNEQGVALAGMCDAGEEHVVRRALDRRGLGSPRNRAEMEALGFFVCVEDLEDELIRASDRKAIEALLESQGDLDAFRTMQQQPPWRHQAFDAQVHRWLRAGARRHLRYARLLVADLGPGGMPRPLEALMITTAALAERAP